MLYLLFDFCTFILLQGTVWPYNWSKIWLFQGKSLLRHGNLYKNDLIPYKQQNYMIPF